MTGKELTNLACDLIQEFNDLHISGLEVKGLYLMMGEDVNIECQMPNGSRMKILNDFAKYLATQVKVEDKYYELVANENMLLVAVTEKDKTAPEVVVYKKR